LFIPRQGRMSANPAGSYSSERSFHFANMECYPGWINFWS